MPEIKRFVVALLFLLLITACSSEEMSTQVELPDHISHLENLVVMTPQNQKPDTVELIREVVFESNDEVFIEGYISRIAVDESDRLYVAATAPGTVGVFLFEPDGRFITRFAREGRGPGEYESIGSIEINGDQVYLFDPRLQKAGIFSTLDFSHLEDILLNRDLISRDDSLASMLRGNELIVPNEEEQLLKSQRFTMSRETDLPIVTYNRVSKNGVIQPAPLLIVDRFPFYFRVETDRPELPFLMPFTLSSLVSLGDDGRFYTNWTEDFLIKIYNSKGIYERAIYHPMEKSRLNMRDFDVSRDRQRALNQYELPLKWPAVHTMELDDEERLWVATITESDTTFQWHVLDQQGDMVARFQKPGRRAGRSVMSKPMYLIQNGHFYSRERNLNQGIDRVVKYRIEFRESQ